MLMEFCQTSLVFLLVAQNVDNDIFSLALLPSALVAAKRLSVVVAFNEFFVVVSLGHGLDWALLVLELHCLVKEGWLARLHGLGDHCVLLRLELQPGVLSEVNAVVGDTFLPELPLGADFVPDVHLLEQVAAVLARYGLWLVEHQPLVGGALLLFTGVFLSFELGLLIIHGRQANLRRQQLFGFTNLAHVRWLL